MSMPFCFNSFAMSPTRIEPSDALTALANTTMGSCCSIVCCNPTENKALKIVELETDCELIERTVKRICADYDALADAKNLLGLSEFILLNVTTSNSYNSWRSLKSRGYNIPVGRDMFYLLRNRFFCELSKHFE